MHIQINSPPTTRHPSRVLVTLLAPLPWEKGMGGGADRRSNLQWSRLTSALVPLPCMIQWLSHQLLKAMLPVVERKRKALMMKMIGPPAALM